QLDALLDAQPEARWHQWDAVGRDGAHAGSVAAFGQRLDTRYRLENADVILALDADPLGRGPARLRHTRDYVRRRRVGGAQPMNRLYVVESSPTVTGSMADHRLALTSVDVETLARAVASGLGVRGAAAGGAPPPGTEKWIDAVVRDLAAHRGSSVVIAGD